ncbi:MAG: phosphoglycerate kinase [Phycisphaerales bacterium]|nr:phosphoglycerate kinase [Phycisphaerales bacterium]
MPRQSIDHIDVQGKRVLVRVDFNVPLDEHGCIVDDRRIRMAIPTLRSVLDRGGSLVLMSHLGRPAGRGWEAKYSLQPAADRLSELLPDASVRVPGADCIGADAVAAVESLEPGGVLVLENLRFHAGEKQGDADFAQVLAGFGDVYVNDAFGTAHRNHASMVAVPEAMADRPRVAGLLLLKELQFLAEAIEHASAPFIAILGGAKVSDKLGAIRNLLPRVDAVIIGGGMAYTFLKIQGMEIGDSLYEADMADEAVKVLDAAAEVGTVILLPVDHQCAPALDAADQAVTIAGDIPAGMMGLDIGPSSASAAVDLLCGARTIVWNGPMGVFERPPCDAGSLAVAQAVAKATANGAATIIGGGETAAAMEQFSLAGDVSHVSTGGGASLQMLEGKSFSSVELLDEEPNQS